MPLVSVIVPCYNQARFVRECLDSVVGQTFADFELIIFDDASTDSTAREIQQWLTANTVEATLVVNEESMGICAVLNQALAQASGRYLAIISGDDLWEPEKLERQVALLESADEHVALVYSDAMAIDEDGNVVRQSLLSENGTVGPADAPSGDVFAAFLQRNYIATVTPLIRSSAVAAVGGYDESLSCEDWDMWLRLSSRYEFRYSEAVTGSRRFHETAAGRNRKHSLAIWRSHVATHEKWLGINPQHDRISADQISYHAWMLYCATGEPDSVASLGLAARVHGRPTNVARFLVARLGIRPGVIERAARLKTALHRLSRSAATKDT
jgi:glycosyltransferase involved in cell wall biosynthesis